MNTQYVKHFLWIRVFVVTIVMLSLLSFGDFKSESIVFAQQQTYNTAFLTDAQLEDYNSMNADQIRAFLSSYNSYFKQSIKDVDGQTFDPAVVIAQAASQYKINPKVILATLQKESSGVTRTTRPSDATMKFLMGCVKSSTAREQLSCAAERFRAYQDQLNKNGVTVSGWKVGTAKNTQDGVSVTPATKAIAGQFTYTPYAGTKWGGNNSSIGGVYLFYKAWIDFGFNGPTGYKFCANENQRCSFSGRQNVAYGANGKFNYKYGITGGVDCNNSTFGDPISGVGKACYTKSVVGPSGYTFCSNENGRCNFSGKKSVAYGADGKFNYKTVTGGVDCNNATFGDPISGVVKACFYK